MHLQLLGITILLRIGSGRSEPYPAENTLSSDSSDEQCEPRIVNGTNASSGDFPFVVSLRKNGSHFCGGTIVTNRWIMSAAHCFPYNVPFSKVESSVQVGRTKIARKLDESVHSIQGVITHPLYDQSNSMMNDICLVLLVSPLKFSGYVQPVPLPPVCSEADDNRRVTVVGWGITENEGKPSKILQKLDLQVITNKECSSRHQAVIHDSQVCADSQGGGKSECK
ncbi:transmembrane protease serine 9-like isoform X2 [Topomyia yanbarensis]|nr:transmembrane protease serine 9-like isoform X2 [Topomyia yanbarensis]